MKDMTTTCATTTAIPADKLLDAEIIHAAIAAIASRCDGATERDKEGFTASDTHFGKAIGSAPLSAWSEAILDEAARIAGNYVTQIKRYTGVDIREVALVKALAEESSPIFGARDDARALKAKAHRTAEILPDGRLAIGWGRDPEFSDLLSGVRRLPGRRWDASNSRNVVDLTPEAIDFVEEHAFTCVGWSPDAEVRQVAVEAAQEAASAPWGRIYVKGGKVIVETPYDGACVQDTRNLPGRKWDGSVNTVNASPEVLAFAEKWNCSVTDEVRALIDGAAEAQVIAAQEEARETAEGALRLQVSRLANPADLPADFVARVLAACPKATVR